MIEAVQRLEVGIDAYECKSARKAGPHRNRVKPLQLHKGDDSSGVPTGADWNPRSIRLSTRVDALTSRQGGLRFRRRSTTLQEGGLSAFQCRWCKLTLVQVAGLGPHRQFGRKSPFRSRAAVSGKNLFVQVLRRGQASHSAGKRSLLDSDSGR